MIRQHLCPAALVAFVGAFRFAPSLEDYSLLQLRLKSGELLLFGQTITESISWSIAGAPWRDMEWLSNAFLAMLFAVGGPETLVVLGMQYLFCFAALLPLSVLLKREGLGGVPRVLGLLTYVMLCPQLVYAGAAAGYLLLPLCFLTGRLWTTFVIALVWVNADQSFVLLPLFLLAENYRQNLPKVFAVLCASLLNPIGFYWWSELLATIASKSQGFSTPHFQTYPELAVGVVALIVARQFIEDKRVGLVLLGVLAMFLAEELTPLFAIMTAISLSSAVGKLGHEKIVSFIGAVITGLSLIYFLARSIVPIGDLPSGVRDLGTAPSRVLNEISLGGDLAFSGTPPFIDQRIELFSRAQGAYSGSIYSDYQKLKVLADEWQEILEFWKFEGAVLRYDSSLATALVEQEGWRMVSRTFGPLVEEKGRMVDKSVCLLMPPK